MRACGFKRVLFRVAASVTLLAGSAVALRAQRAITLQLVSTNGASIQLLWQAQSVVPAPGLPIFPDYQIHRSADLKTWAPVGERFVGGIGGTNNMFSFLDATAGEPMTFYRVETSVQLANADLIGEKLAGGDFSSGDLFGADLFGADLTNIIYNQATR